MKKRQFLQASVATLGSVTLAPLSACASGLQSTPKAAQGKFEITKTEAEWRRILTDAQFNVLRKQSTEARFSSPLDKLVAKGTYRCAGCDLPLFLSATKFDSHTGWPSFYAPINGAVGTTVDRSFLMVRTEVHCRRCGGHLGHVFDDGPAPTGKRYCMNGVAIKFTPEAAIRS